MKKNHILIVEDEDDIASILKLNLESDGYNVSILSDGNNVLSQVKTMMPDAILLDVMIPGSDGFEVCKDIKSNDGTKHIPIIFITAKSLEHNVISGLEIGADDYITKPFSISIVLARLKTILRRSKQASKPSSTNRVESGGVHVDKDRMIVTVNGSEITLTTSEFQLLEYLMQKPGWVFKRTQLLEACKGEDNFVTDRTIDVLIVSLRKKLGDSAHLIETVRGVGYKFKDVEN